MEASQKRKSIFKVTNKINSRKEESEKNRNKLQFPYIVLAHYEHQVYPLLIKRCIYTKNKLSRRAVFYLFTLIFQNYDI